jgi:hypothetical protein
MKRFGFIIKVACFVTKIKIFSALTAAELNWLVQGG